VFSLAPASAPSAAAEDRASKFEDRKEKGKDRDTAKRPGESSILNSQSSILDETSASVADTFISPGGDYPHRYIIWISPRVVPWIAPVALAMIFFLFFFPWRSVPRSLPFESLGLPGSQIGWATLFSNAFFIFYFLIYLMALALAIGSLLLSLTLVPALPQIQHLVPWKAVIVAGMVAFAFLPFLIGYLREDFATIWMSGVAWLHFIALIGLALEFWLQRRGANRPMPRIDVLW
jgi:hypothetical protein